MSTTGISLTFSPFSISLLRLQLPSKRNETVQTRPVAEEQAEAAQVRKVAAAAAEMTDPASS